MKLREKFKTEFSINTSGESGRFADKCESIADNHAVDFAKWFRVKCISSSMDYHLTVEQLLEIYKKEKNL